MPKQGKGNVKAIHYIQSFDPKDIFSPELAHQIARTFARKAFGDSCQVVIANHVDKQHVHSHIIINAYGIDGRKFNDNQTTLKQIRENSDRVCLAFGIKPIDTERGAGRNVAYNEWEHKRRGKYISVKTPEQQRALRLKALGEDCTIECLASRILWKDVGSGGTLLGQPSELSERYSATIYDVEQHALTGRRIQRKRDTSAPYSPQNDMDV